MILITGISGFIGTNLAKKLQHHGYSLIGLTKNTDRFVINNEEIPIYKSSEGDLEKIFKNHTIEIIIHLATEYERGEGSIDQIFDTNFNLPSKLTELSIRYNCELFINCESFFQKKSNNGYAQDYVDSKNLFRKFLIKKSSRIQSVSLQLEHAYGPHDNKSKLFPHVIKSAVCGKNSLDLGFCGLGRDLIFIDDVVDAFIIIVKAERNLLKQKYEIGLGQTINLDKAIKILLKIISKKMPESKLKYSNIHFSKSVNNQIISSHADNNSLIKLGWTPKYSVDKGLAATVDSYLNISR
jgi:CDP-paratose synthetase